MYRGILVYNICPISISHLVSDGDSHLTSFSMQTYMQMSNSVDNEVSMNPSVAIVNKYDEFVQK